MDDSLLLDEMCKAIGPRIDIRELYRVEYLADHCVKVAKRYATQMLKHELMKFVEANNYFSLGDAKNASGVIDTYLKFYCPE